MTKLYDINAAAEKVTPCTTKELLTKTDPEILLQKIKSSVEQIVIIEQRIKEEKNLIKGIELQLAAAGISKAALDSARKFSDIDPDQATTFDMQYQICRRALGYPVQTELKV